MSAQSSVQMENEPFATPVEVAETSGNGQFVSFFCGNRAFGIDIMRVREIRSWSPTTELPDQPQSACGVLDIRGEIIQVYDLNSVLGSGRTEVTDGHVVLVVNIEGQTIGILVDAVSDIIHVGKEDMRPAPRSNGGMKVVSGIAKHEDKLVAILDLKPIVANVGL